ncbi:hypothetical protein CN514_10465 [Bacillus sp. AFS001701]|uniref:hypothetical protein n=1 Tax=Bacillaceae TaxID=186817 RepID=UPI000BF97C49|nr:hypothetical protein [Bacillus sp. AFS001701]PET67315.1 hypothetical protein CN514_10465 [Bacillus sp. AFS001701]
MKKYLGFKKLGVAILTAGILCVTTPTFAASPVQYKIDSAKKENAQLNYIKKEGYKLEKPVQSVVYYDTSHVQESKAKLKASSATTITTNAVVTPKAIAVEPGTTRVTTYQYPVSGSLYFVEKKSGATANSIWNVSMYIVGKLVGTVGGFIQDGLSLALDSVDKTAGASVQTFKSYRYTEKNGQVYKTSKSWGTYYTAEQEETFKHALNAYRSKKYNETRTVHVDYVPSRGYSAFKIAYSTHYKNNKAISDRAWTNWYKGYNYYTTPEFAS